MVSPEECSQHWNSSLQFHSLAFESQSGQLNHPHSAEHEIRPAEIRISAAFGRTVLVDAAKVIFQERAGAARVCHGFSPFASERSRYVSINCWRSIPRWRATRSTSSPLNVGFISRQPLAQVVQSIPDHTRRVLSIGAVFPRPTDKSSDFINPSARLGHRRTIGCSSHWLLAWFADLDALHFGAREGVPSTDCSKSRVRDGVSRTECGRADITNTRDISSA